MDLADLSSESVGVSGPRLLTSLSQRSGSGNDHRLIISQSKVAPGLLMCHLIFNETTALNPQSNNIFKSA